MKSNVYWSNLVVGIIITFLAYNHDSILMGILAGINFGYALCVILVNFTFQQEKESK